MKKAIIWIWIICLTILTGEAPAQESVAADSVRILLVNPGQGDLIDMAKMVQQGVVPLKNPLLIAVYGAAVERRREAILSRVAGEAIGFIRFEVVEGQLHAGNLYERNDCSAAFERLFAGSDAALFYGGADIPPVVYGQKTHLLTGIVTPERHFFELSFLFHLLGGSQNPAFTPLLEKKPDYVIRGFCLGMQTLNVATGGTMYQDIPSEIYKLRYVEDYLQLDAARQHDNYWGKLLPHDNFFWCHFQPIRFKPDGFFVKEMKRDAKELPLVCSSHHQAVRKLGRDLQVAATSLDGKVVEALTHKHFKNVLAVQFHPENYAIYSEQGGSKLTPADTALVSLHQYMRQHDSLDFHLAFWRQFSEALKH